MKGENKTLTGEKSVQSRAESIRWHGCEIASTNGENHGHPSLQELDLPRSFAATRAFLEILPSACPKLSAVFFGKAPAVNSSLFKKWLDDTKPPRGALKEVHILGGRLEGLVSDAELRWTAWDGSGDWGLHVGELVGIVGLD
ncbi:hypothetical protein BDK51DRAFT_28662 [Blyttiomyces helicus]|uniref:Uncharacterized protein n=1 Tax=Blyttiomyces helicus TaxID=388810 RepID=A0A4V1IS57_9FUNG|nr:hypothetical protein BDK51DRAFT_28662 [Blyttiomyces helicus]|eukprot:RKO92397.1 hypothetical protein BDK51DRAFT_28662 [Blyttiomyces helicus]